MILSVWRIKTKNWQYLLAILKSLDLNQEIGQQLAI